MLTLKSLLLMCVQDERVKEYVWGLPPPVLSNAKYVDFFEQFIDTYIKDGMKLSHSTFPKV